MELECGNFTEVPGMHFWHLPLSRWGLFVIDASRPVDSAGSPRLHNVAGQEKCQVSSVCVAGYAVITL
jgi:hypothetical protein